jgi:hypothetical protein
VLSAQVLTFAEEAVGSVHSAVDCSWPRENSRVWRIIAGPEKRTWYVKQHPTPKFHAREVDAYTRWAPALGPGRVPELQAASTDLAAVLLTALSGINLHHHELPPEEEREVHLQLGVLLRAFHSSGPPCPPEDARPILGKIERHLTASELHLTPEVADLVTRMATRLAALAPLPHVPIHGDAQIRNTIWNPETRTLALIDFERAEYGPALRDLIRLEYGPWDGRPDLREAFLDGFGRTLTAAESKHLQAMAALDAVSGIAFGTSAGDVEVVSRGYRTLDRLLRGVSS